MASRACGNRLSLRNQYDTKTPRASSQGLRPGPAPEHSVGRTKLASRKNPQRGFRVAPGQAGVPLKLSVENFLEPARSRLAWATKKSSGAPEVPPDSSCAEQHKSFPTYHLRGGAASRPGGQVPELHWWFGFPIKEVSCRGWACHAMVRKFSHDC